MPKAAELASTVSTPLAIEINLTQSQAAGWADQVNTVEQARIYLRALSDLLALLDPQVAQIEMECARRRAETATALAAAAISRITAGMHRLPEQDGFAS